MSDNPAKSFKDFIGWAFAGGAVVILSLVTMIYSSVNAQVQQNTNDVRVHAERIKGSEVGIEAIKQHLERIEAEVKKGNQMLEELKRR